MLMAKALRKIDGAALVDFLGVERDTKTKEFVTSNIGDSLQVCNTIIVHTHVSPPTTHTPLTLECSSLP